MERDILLLGDPRLYEVSEEVTREELEELRPVFTDLFDCISRIQRSMISTADITPRSGTIGSTSITA